MFGIPFVSTIRNAVIVALLSSVVGFGAGYYTKHKFALAEIHEAVTEQRKEDAHALADMQAKEAALQAQLDEERARIETIQREIKPHVIYRTVHAKPQKPTPGTEGLGDPAPEQDCPAVADGGTAFLDVATVRLLDDARAGAADAPAWGDAEVEAAADVSVTEFVQNDLEVVGMYHDLATRHDALVEWVEGLLKKQK